MIQFKIKKLANGKELLAVGVPMESKNHISMKVDPDLGMINGLHYDLPHKGVLEQLPNKGTFHVIGTCTPSTGEIDFGIEDSIRRNWVNVPPGEFYNTKRKESFLSLITQSATEAGFYIVNPSPIQVLIIALLFSFSLYCEFTQTLSPAGSAGVSSISISTDHCFRWDFHIINKSLVE